MTLPLLPPISSNAALTIFTHRSFRSSEFNNDNLGDGDRLAFLGKRVLDMVVAEIHFKKRPMLHDDRLQVSTPAA
jgi:dsRNA-specific ribonuclease